jgi:hypothetical protein
LRADDTVAPRLSFENHLQIINAMWEQQTFALYQRITSPTTLIVAEPSTVSAAQAGFVSQRQADLAYLRQVRPDIPQIGLLDTIHDIPLQRPRELATLIAQAVS